MEDLGGCPVFSARERLVTLPEASISSRARGKAVFVDLLPHVPDAVLEIARTLREQDFECYLVGGSIRDLVRGADPKDWDLATDATPDQVQPLFQRTIPTGIRFGTITIMIRAVGYEITTFRAEGGYSDGRRPDVVQFASSIEDDLCRRDFTFNAMALNLESGAIVDVWNGRQDLAAGIVRAVGNARERLGEDGLRILRAFRFRRMGKLDEDLLEAITENHEMLDRIARERVLMEMEQILPSELGSDLVLEMADCGVLPHVLGIFGEMDRGQLRAGSSILGRLPAPSFPMALAAVLQPSGAEASRFQKLGRELKMSTKDIDEFVALSTQHHELRGLAVSAVGDLRWFRYERRKYLDSLLILAAAVYDDDETRELVSRIATVTIPETIPLVDGKAIMKQFELATGPSVGRIKNYLTEVQVRENIQEAGEMSRRLAQLDIGRFTD